MAILDAIGTGIQFFQFGDTELEAAQIRQSKMDLMLSSTDKSSLYDAIEAPDVKIQLPPSYRSNRNVRRLKIWLLSILLANHRVHRFLGDHYNNMESFLSIWSTCRPALFTHFMRACDVFHLKYMSTKLS